jgi:hypothetical protein
MDQYTEFAQVARDILTQRPLDAAAVLGLDDLLDGPITPESEVAGYAFLEAQGYTGAVTSVLSNIALADPLLRDVLRHRPPASSALEIPSPGTQAWMVFGTPADQVIVDIEDRGLLVVPCAPLPGGRYPLIEDAYAHMVHLDITEGDLLLPRQEMEPLRRALTARLRFGVAAEILGTSDRMLDDALDYTKGRSQFGHSISSYQSIRDLLAWASTELHQLRQLLACCWSLRPLSSPDNDGLAMVAKALAGTCGMRIARSTMQATGAIAFTADYRHGSQHRRILALDAIAGSCADLTRQIGRDARTGGAVPSYFSLDELADSVRP